MQCFTITITVGVYLTKARTQLFAVSSVVPRLVAAAQCQPRHEVVCRVCQHYASRIEGLTFDIDTDEYTLCLTTN